MSERPSAYDDMSADQRRFHAELEFVQALANPRYLTFLAQYEFLKDQRFVNYLKYLLYWKRPEYAVYLKYPQCLHFLGLLQNSAFRKELEVASYGEYVENQQLLQWLHYTQNRTQREVPELNAFPPPADQPNGTAGAEHDH
eukprot:m.51442 g.51442  ORF g.51442 m.51442 type:complete len:141 (-) comp12624_c0_seq4:539-961(-)